MNMEMSVNKKLLRYIKRLFIPVVSGLLFSTGMGYSQPDTVRVMPLGNSITQGIWCTNENIFDDCTEIDTADAVGYRLNLYDSLTNQGYVVDFVGSESSGSNFLTDTDHAGFPGINDDNLADLMETGFSDHTGSVTSGPYMDSYPADIVFLHIGTNDVLANDTGNVDGLVRILDAIDDYEISSGNPVTVFLARIISHEGSDCGTHPGTAAYNRQIDSVAEVRIAAGDNIVVLDLECGAGIDYSTDMADQVHPFQSGYDKMGDYWYANVDSFLTGLTSHTLTMEIPVGNGTVSPDTGSYLYPDSSNALLTATPDEGWEFTGWTGSENTVLNPLTLLMHEDKTITANFSQITYTLTVTDDGTTGAATSPSGSETVNYGENTAISVTSVPANYEFDNWTVTSGTANIADPNQSSTTVSLTSGDATVQANFRLVTYQLTVGTDGTGGSSTTPSGTVTVEHGVGENITATIPTGYSFDGWTVTSGTASFADAADPTTTVTLTSGNASIQANFIINTYQLTVGTDGTLGVSTTPDGTVSVDHGVSTNISATTPTGYSFDSWTVTSGTASIADDTDPTTAVTLTSGDASIQANFVLSTYQLTVDTDGTSGASTTPSGTVTVEHGVGENITATPPTGYSFDGWTVTSGTANFADAADPTTTVTLTSGNASIRANFIINTYQLTVGTDGTLGVSTTPDGTVSVDHGVSTNISATTPAGYSFDSWTVTSGTASIADDTDPTTTVTLTSGNASIQANFVIESYNLNINLNGDGSVTRNPDQPNYTFETDVELMAFPSTGWQFDNWSGDVTGSANPVTVTMDSEKSVTANFSLKIYQLTVTTDGTTGAVTDPSGNENVEHGVSTNISATPPAGYSFDGWSVTSGVVNFGNTGDPTTTVTLTSGDASIRANFTLDTYQLTIGTDDTEGASTLPSGTSTVNHGEPTAITANAPTGYSFDSWTVVSGTASFGDATDPTTTVTLTSGDASIRANFSLNTYLLTVGTDNTSGSSTTPSGTFTVNHGESTDISATAPAGYSFVNWTVVSGTATIGNTADPATTVTLTSGNADVQANFEQDIYVLNTTANGNGTISRSPDQPDYLSGTNVDLLATPDEGWEFDNWSGDITGNSNPVTLTMDSDKTVAANFSQITFALTVTADGTLGATTNPLGTVNVNYGESTSISVSSIPVGYEFVNWTVAEGIASIADPNVTNTTVVLTDGAASVQANFVLKEYTIVASAGTGGSITPSGNVIVDHGSDQEFTITPDEGYEIDDVLVNGTSVGPLASYTFTDVTADANISASFVLKTYSVTATAGLNGSIDPPGESIVDHGGSQSYTITPAEGYNIEDVLVDGLSVGAVETHDFINVTADHTISASFIIKTFTVSATAGLNGTITPAGDTEAEYGSDLTYTITPDEGYEVEDVLIDGISAGPLTEYTFTSITEDHSISVSFVLKTYTMTATAGENGTISPAGETIADHGSDLIYTIVPDEGYEVEDVLVDGLSVGPVTEYTFTDITSDHTISVSFVIKTYLITATAGENGQILPAGITEVEHGSALTYTITPDEGYEIEDVIIDSVSQGPLEEFTFADVTRDHTIEVSFIIKTYTLSSSAGLNGTISPLGDTIVEHGSTQIYTITPDEGYEVEDVIVDGVSAGPLTEYTFADITEAHSISVSFIIKTYIVQATAGLNGTILPEGEIEVEHGSDLEFTITPDEGYIIDDVLVNGLTAGTPETYLLSNITEAQTIEAAFIKLVEVEDLTIPNDTMSIGDTVTATLTVTYDAGFPYSLVSGEVGGYNLINLQRIDLTTYTADFIVTEGGNSYTSAQAIPVTNLVLTDGDVVSEVYTAGIEQDADLLDAERPVINFIWVEEGNKSVGETVQLLINADDTGYRIDSSSLVNGIPVTESNIVFSEVGTGTYSLSYIVEEGDNDVAAGELTASVALVKPSGNTSDPFTSLDNISNLIIDANPPVITKMEVPEGEFGIGEIIEVTITADGEGYTAGSGTVINDTPVSSSRVNFTEQSGGVYILSYTVAIGDNSVEPGELQLSVYLRDDAGNDGGPYTDLEANSLSVYTELPTATIGGTQAICEGDAAQLTIYLTGRSPWSIYLSDGSETTLYEEIYSSTYTIDVVPTETTTYSIDLVSDANGALNSGNGTATVTVRERTDVEILNLKSSYNVEADPFVLEADVAGGTFSGPGVNSVSGIFDPGLADTINSPHTIYYTYTNPAGCTSIDSALVFVLGAKGDIYIPNKFYCDNHDPFLVSASNISDIIGSFVLLDSTGTEVNGLTDNGDNTATVNPVVLNEGPYTVEYSYTNNVTFYLRDSFRIEGVDAPDILIPDRNEYCRNEQPFALSSSVAGAVFEGPGISLVDGEYIFDPGAAEIGNNVITASNTSSSGCSKTISKTIRINQVPSVSFEADRLCVSENDTVFFNNTTEDKHLITEWSWDFGDPESGEMNTGNRENPWHVYKEAGAREVKLFGVTEKGCVDSLVRTIEFEDNPTGTITWDNECFIDEVEVTFTSDMMSKSPVVSYEWTITDTADESVSITGAGSIKYTFDEMSTYNIELLTETRNGCTGIIEKEIMLKPVINIAEDNPYVEDFNNNQGWWTANAADSSAYLSWDYNVVNLENINDNLSRGWYTDLPDAPVKEYSWIRSPCINFKESRRPMISMDIYRSMTGDEEGVVLQYTRDGGNNWHTIGEKGKGINWYNSDQIAINPGGSPSGWTGEQPFAADNGWVGARHHLDSLAGGGLTQFRIAFASEHDSDVEGREGFALDNIVIRERDRKVLLEHFTNTSDMDTREENMRVNSLYNDHFKDMVKLEYHTSFPGEDPFNAHNSAVPATRALYYGVTDVPYALFNGGYTPSLRFGFNPEQPEKRDVDVASLQDGLFGINLYTQYTENQVIADVQVTALEDLDPEERIVHVVVFEKLITGVSTVNGATNFLNVVKDMLPNSAGTAEFDRWTKGQTRNYTLGWNFANVYDPEMLRVAVFVQNDNTKEVYQVATDDYTNITTEVKDRETYEDLVNIYPNPAYDHLFININNRHNRDYTVELFDQVGRSVIRRDVYKYEDLIQISTEALDRGVYYVKVMDKENGVVLRVEKVVVMK